MAATDDLVAWMRQKPAGVRFRDLCKVCDHYFGKPRSQGTSHRIYRTPWPGDPCVNIQSDAERAKSYQVRQVLKAIERLGNDHGEAG
jgi:hypothetical protein